MSSKKVTAKRSYPAICGVYYAFQCMGDYVLGSSINV